MCTYTASVFWKLRCTFSCTFSCTLTVDDTFTYDVFSMWLKRKLKAMLLLPKRTMSTCAPGAVISSQRCGKSIQNYRIVQDVQELHNTSDSFVCTETPAITMPHRCGGHDLWLHPQRQQERVEYQGASDTCPADDRQDVSQRQQSVQTVRPPGAVQQAPQKPANALSAPRTSEEADSKQ